MVVLLLGVGGIAALVAGVALLLASAGDTTGSIAPTSTNPTTVASTTLVPGGFVEVTDDSGALTVSVPADWTDTATSAWTRDGVEVGPSVSASTDRAAWLAGWDTPGLFIGATDQIAFADAFGEFSDACVLDRTSAIAADGLAGTAEWWSDCGAAGTDFFVGVLTDPGTPMIVVLQVGTASGDLVALIDHLLSTLSYQESR